MNITGTHSTSFQEAEENNKQLQDQDTPCVSLLKWAYVPLSTLLNKVSKLNKLNFMAQLYTNDLHFCQIYPMKNKSNAPNMLSTFIHEIVNLVQSTPMMPRS
jgi:hypothetical protein